MSEERWDDIDGGWDEVDVASAKRRRTRARGSRGKRRATAQSAPANEPVQQQKKRKTKHRPKPAIEAKATRLTKTPRPAWLFPMLAFGAAIVVFVLYLFASNT